MVKSLGIGIGLKTNLSLFGPSYEAESLALFARMTSQPDAFYKGVYNDLIGGMIDDGTWTTQDAFYFFSGNDSQASLLNWVDSNTASIVNAPAFVAHRGFTGNGTTSYIDTGLVASTLTKFLQDSANLSAWTTTEVNTGPVAGLVSGSNLQLYPRNSGLQNARINNGTSRTIAQASSIGLATINRSGAAASQHRRNGVQISTFADARTASAITFLHNSTVFGAMQVAVGAIGGSLTDAQELNRYNRINTALQAIGAA